jgi:metal-responsive CopG/Arc/MetJ family transcriptional regulator
MKMITVKMEEDLLEQLDAFAIRNKLNRSEAIRLAIQKMLKEEQKKMTVPKAKVEKGFKLR